MARNPHCFSQLAHIEVVIIRMYITWKKTWMMPGEAKTLYASLGLDYNWSNRKWEVGNMSHPLFSMRYLFYWLSIAYRNRLIVSLPLGIRSSVSSFSCKVLPNSHEIADHRFLFVKKIGMTHVSAFVTVDNEEIWKKPAQWLVRHQVAVGQLILGH